MRVGARFGVVRRVCCPESTAAVVAAGSVGDVGECRWGVDLLMAQRKLLLAWAVFVAGWLQLSAVAGGLALFAPPSSDGARLWAVVMVAAALVGIVGCVVAASHLVWLARPVPVVPLPEAPVRRVGPAGPRFLTASRSPQVSAQPVDHDSVWPLTDRRQS